MRKLLLALLIGVSGAALLPAHKANAWWDAWGRWHPSYYAPRFYGPRVVVVPPPVYAPPAYYRPYARWIPPHYDPWGRFIPGHWA